MEEIAKKIKRLESILAENQFSEDSWERVLDDDKRKGIQKQLNKLQKQFNIIDNTLLLVKNKKCLLTKDSSKDNIIKMCIKMCNLNEDTDDINIDIKPRYKIGDVVIQKLKNNDETIIERQFTIIDIRIIYTFSLKEIIYEYKLKFIDNDYIYGWKNL